MTDMNAQHNVRQNTINGSNNWWYALLHIYCPKSVTVRLNHLLMLAVSNTCQGWISKLQGLSVTVPAGYGTCPFHASSVWTAG